MERPQPGDYAEYYQQYIERVPDGPIIEILEQVHRETQEFIQGIDEEKSEYRYAEGKWSIKEVLIHVIDTERIMGYRALTFARGDKTELPGFDQDIYGFNSGAKDRTIKDIAQEMGIVRNASISLFKNFSDEMMAMDGIGNNNKVTVNSVAYLLVGHELHHMNVIREKYLAS